MAGLFTSRSSPSPGTTPAPSSPGAPPVSSPAARSARTSGPVRSRPLRVHSLTAATRSRSRGSSSPTTGGGSSVSGGWQAEAWKFYDTVGELRFVCEWISSALSQCRLVPSGVDSSGFPTGWTDVEAVRRIVADIAGGPAGQSSLLSKMATHLTVPGELYLAILQREEGDGTVEEWHVLSSSEVTKGRNGDVTVRLPDGSVWDLDDEQDSLERIWLPHARNAAEPDSLLRAALPTLREITRLSQWVEATAKSRLVSNGILAVPNEMVVPQHDAPGGSTAWRDRDAPGLPATPETEPEPVLLEGQDAGPEEDLAALLGGIPEDRKSGPEALTDALLETFSTAVQDPSSAAALTPIVIEAPGEMIGQIKHISIASDFTDTVMKLRDSAIKRLSLSLNVPAEVLMGTGGMNHWGAWQVEESAIKMHVEPLLIAICDRLTTYLLHPLLREQGVGNAEDYVIWFDTTALAQRPDRGADAKEAYDLGLISGDAYLRYMGFTDDDKPGEAMSMSEQRALAISIVKGAPTLLPGLAHIIGLDVDVDALSRARVPDNGETPRADPAGTSTGRTAPQDRPSTTDPQEPTP